MGMPSHKTCGGVLFALVLVTGAIAANAATKAAPGLPATNSGQRFSISASLVPTAAPTARGNGLELKSRLSSGSSGPPVQEAGGFALIARLAVSPLVCYGDTIFKDGFEGP
ncbi:hypothetical protein [Dokdonella sp.]|uniref:hypothetical protein n=1 Tax=Dokdonella sp. TaxID=2291710 RepID=UPI0025B85969|nr:hypothetical protein [Dokdonella sp.]MBX3690343.1 hypothetical protein [Dokdonella sp.]